MKNKSYIILYYLAFILTLGLVVIYSSTLVTFYGGGVYYLPGLLLTIINMLLVVIFTIRFIKNKKLEKTLIAFPISYMLFIIILYILGLLFDKKIVIPAVEYTYFNTFIMMDYLLLNIYSLLSIKKKKDSI